MTREEQIRNAANELHDGVWQLAPAFAEGARWADQHPKSPWVSVKERRPDIGEDVVILDNSRELHLATVLRLGGFFAGLLSEARILFDVPTEGLSYQAEEVVAWMPIPAPPTEGGAE